MAQLVGCACSCRRAFPAGRIGWLALKLAQECSPPAAQGELSWAIPGATQPIRPAGLGCTCGCSRVPASGCLLRLPRPADVAAPACRTRRAEIASGPSLGVELDSYVRQKGVEGIVNGMDVEEWSPALVRALACSHALDPAVPAAGCSAALLRRGPARADRRCLGATCRPCRKAAQH